MQFNLKNTLLTLVLILALPLSGCSTVKYNTLEKLGIHKRDLLIDNVEDTRDAQKVAQEEFKDALEKFASVVKLEDTSLKRAYDTFSDEYEDSLDAAEDVSDNIRDVEEVAEDLFAEWKRELGEYTDANLRRLSEDKLKSTRTRYNEMHRAMIQAENSMKPVLQTMNNNVLFLKHNLNAQAIGSLKATFGDLQTDIDHLVSQMNNSIERSNQFIRDIDRI